MAERLPYWPCYAADITMSTAEMTDEQVGAYFRLLNHGWLNDGLPTDPEAVRQIGRWSRGEWARIWPVVGPKWAPVNGRLVNLRQEAEREKALRESFAKSAAGRKGAAGRWGKPDGSADATALPALSEANGIQSQSHQDQEPPLPPSRGGLDVAAVDSNRTTTGRRLTRAEKEAARRLGVSVCDGPTWSERCSAAGHERRCQSPTICTLRQQAEADCPHEAPKCSTFTMCSARSAGAA